MTDLGGGRMVPPQLLMCPQCWRHAVAFGVCTRCGWKGTR